VHQVGGGLLGQAQDGGELSLTHRLDRSVTAEVTVG